MISYAYNHEDVLLRRVFGNRRDGFFVDIGAHHPETDSVTKHFSDMGWTGINVEPIPNRGPLFNTSRPLDCNLSAGISDRGGSLTFHEVVDGATLSTFSSSLAAEYRARGYRIQEHQVPVLTLTELFERYAPTTVDFLCIDVEGHERQVLAGGNFQKFRPRVVVVEATQPGTSIATHDDWEHLLVDAGYEFATFDGINRYYVRQEESGLAVPLSVPVNALDEFVPYQQFLLERELRRYRRLNPFRRLVVWLVDFSLAVRRKLRGQQATKRARRSSAPDGLCSNGAEATTSVNAREEQLA